MHRRVKLEGPKGDTMSGIEHDNNDEIIVGSTYLMLTVWESRGWHVTERAEEWEL